MGPSDGEMLGIGATAGFIFGVVLVLTGAAWWALPVAVVASAVLAVLA